MPRSDAARNRLKLIAAAEIVFRDHGASAPLDLVVQEAGVGRATLYRNFPDRQSLVSAVYESRFEVFEALLERVSGGELLEAMLREIWKLHKDSPGLFAVMNAGTPGREELVEMGLRMRDMLATAVREAHETGTLHPDVSEETVLHLLVMLPGSDHLTLVPGAVPMGDEVLELLLRGLRP